MTKTTLPHPSLMIYNALDSRTPSYTYDCHKCTHPEAVDTEGVYMSNMFDTMPEAVADRRKHIEEFHPDYDVVSHHGQTFTVKFNRSVLVYRNGFLQSVKVCESRMDAERWVREQQMSTSAYRSISYRYDVV